MIYQLDNSDITNGIPDPVDSTFEATGDIDTSVYDDLASLDQEMIKCREAASAYESIQSYGADRSMLYFAYKNHLVSASSYGAIESCTDPVLMTQLALEAVAQEASEASKTWAGKAVQIVSQAITKCGDMIHSIAETMIAKIKASGTKIKENATAHPYATVASVIAAVTLTAGAVVMTRGLMTPAALSNSASVTTIGEKIAAAFSRIKTVFSKSDVVFKDGKFSQSINETAQATKEGAQKGGWKFSSVKMTESALARALSSLWEALKSFGSTVVTGLQKTWKFAKPHIKTAAHAADSAAAKVINTGNEIASSDKHNFVVKLVAGMFVFTFVKSLITLVIKTCHWVIGLARNIVAKTVIAICGEEAPKPDSDNPEDLLK